MRAGTPHQTAVQKRRERGARAVGDRVPRRQSRTLDVPLSRASALRARRARLDAEDPDVLARFFHGLADPTRVEILLFLLDGPKTAGEIVRHVGRYQPSVSAHLTCLRFCGYVEARRDGRNVRYELIDRRVRRLVE